jgi:hypothetical protein
MTGKQRSVCGRRQTSGKCGNIGSEGRRTSRTKESRSDDAEAETVEMALATHGPSSWFWLEKDQTRPAGKAVEPGYSIR